MWIDIDELDRRLLAIVQENARLPAEKIGTAVGLSASAVQRRLTRLRDAGVIASEVAVVDPKMAGFPLTMIVDIEVERERPELLAGFKRWISAEPAVQASWYVTGDSDFVLVVSARDVEEYDALMQRLVADNANVRRFRTRVALGTVKRGLALPLDR
jgi:Lrp/AsnC family leucine-responsive transcriptional regulator